jgi:eukaryotic-like serine/threonine-protein kinase
MIGKTIGKYRIVERLGRGGMGVVYKAVDETLDRVVAIKTLNPGLLEDEAIKRFRAEAVTVARLNHPRIAGVYELTREDDSLLMVMEFVSGETFERLATRAGRLQIDHATSLCCAVLEALQYAHAAGVVHRDLKPANLMLTTSGDVKVMDFGIARVVGTEHLTSEGFMMGTPAYMAPEQVRGLAIDHRTDLYAIAVVLYRLLTGRLPFKADTPIAMIQSQVSDTPTPPRELRAELPEWLDATLARALAKAPADRFQSANEFRLALEEGLGVATSTRFDTRAYGLDALLETAPVVTPSAMRLPAPTPYQPKTQPMAQPVPAPTQPMAPPAPTHTPTAVRVARGETTVTLRTPHLAVAAVLLALLVVGVGGLTYVALRRPPDGAGATSSVPPPVPSSTDAAAPTPPPPDVDAPAPPSEPPAVEAPAPLPPIVAAPPKPAIAPRPPSPAGTQSTRPTAPAQPPAPTAQAADPVPSEVSDTPPIVAPEPRPAVEHPLLKFSEVRVLVADGSKTKEQDVSLTLESGGIVVRNGKGDQVLKALPYQEVLSATYSESKRPHWNATPGVAGVPSAFGGSGSLFQRSRHWLTLQSKDDFLILRLEKDNLPAILPAIESRTGAHVQKVSEGR